MVFMALLLVNLQVGIQGLCFGVTLGTSHTVVEINVVGFMLEAKWHLSGNSPRDASLSR